MINNIQALKNYYNSQATKSYAFRRNSLLKLKAALLKYENEIYQALYADLKKGKEEAYVTELGMILHEITCTVKNLKKWMRPKRVATNLFNLPSRSKIYKQPVGVVFIIAPWNYPFQLSLMPLVGAIAAGNTVALKPSELAPNAAKLMEKILAEVFEPNHVLTLQGGGAVVVKEAIDTALFDHIFYTGSTYVGKIIYKQAAEQLIPVTLELGGKSPCIVTESAHLSSTAKRIAVAKFSNCGQMCIAPDYVLVHESVAESLIEALKNTIASFFTKDPSSSVSYGKIINHNRYNSLIKYLANGQIVHGGNTNAANLYIEPTIITQVSMDMPIMKEEIFGPILPIITYKTNEEVLSIIAQNPNPLALYVYSKNNADRDYYIQNVSFGCGSINASAFQITNQHLPFGGIRTSGIGSYHGKKSFDIFTHEKSILQTPTWFNPKVKYPPFTGNLNFFKRLLN